MNKLFLMFLTCSILVGQEVDIDNLTVKSGRYFQRSKPYSGSVYDKYFLGGVSLSGKMENGFRIGIWETFFSNGKVEIESTYKNNQVVLEREFYKNGKTKSVSRFQDGSFHGSFKSFYENGMKKTVGSYSKGRWIGEYVMYNKSGKKMFVTNYLEGGVTHGYQITFHGNGNPMTKTYYQNGNKSGETYIYNNKGVQIYP